MLDPQTLRGRLTLASGLALVLSLALFAGFALAVVDGAQRRALDAELATTARTILAVAEARDGRVAMDVSDGGGLRGLVGTNASAAVWQRNGGLVATTSPAEASALRAEAVAARVPSLVARAFPAGDARAYVAPIVVEGRSVGALAVWRATGPVGALDRSVALAFTFAIPLLAALAIVASGAIARRVLAPLGRIAGLASAIEANDLSARLALPPRRDELGALAATFDRMLDRLEAAFERERRFTTDASHELRAPLSVIRAEADLALRRDRSGDEYRRALQSIAFDADRLEEITRELLGAARAEGAGAAETLVDLCRIVADAAARMRVLASARGTSLDIAAPGEAFVRGVPDALLRAVVALLHNALKYAPTGGRVVAAARRVGDAIELCVTDDGPGFTEAALAHGFERFWRGDDTRDRGGSGLGLAIVRAIVLGVGATVTLANAPGGGAAVTLRFPAA